MATPPSLCKLYGKKQMRPVIFVCCDSNWDLSLSIVKRWGCQGVSTFSVACYHVVNANKQKCPGDERRRVGYHSAMGNRTVYGSVGVWAECQGYSTSKIRKGASSFVLIRPSKRKVFLYILSYIAIQMVVVRVCKSLNVDRVKDRYYPQAPAAFHVRIPQILHPRSRSRIRSPWSTLHLENGFPSNFPTPA